MSETNSLTRPLGNNVPLPGGEMVDTPEVRQTLPDGAPGGGPEGPPAPAGSNLPSPDLSFDGTRKTLMQQHSRNKSAFLALNKAISQVDHVMQGLDRLAEKQDTVTMDDVIEEMGKMVSHGIDPQALAGKLADAPQEGGGEALAAWIAQNVQRSTQVEAQLHAQRDMMQHKMGVSAAHLLMAHANSQLMTGPTPPSGPNPLTGS